MSKIPYAMVEGFASVYMRTTGEGGIKFLPFGCVRANLRSRAKIGFSISSLSLFVILLITSQSARDVYE